MVRTGIALLAALGTWVLPKTGPVRGTALLTIAAPIIMINASLLLPTQRRRFFQSMVAAADMIFACALALLVPSAQPVIMMVIIGLAPLHVLWLGGRTALRIDVLAIVLFTSAGLITGPDDWVRETFTFATVLVVLTLVTRSAHKTIITRTVLTEAVTSGLGIAVWRSDGPHHRRFIAGPVERVVGLSPDALNEPGFFESRIHPDDTDVVDRARVLMTAINDPARVDAIPSATGTCSATSRREVSVDYRIIDEDDTIRWIHEEVMISVGDDGTALLHGTMTDETSKVAAARSVQRFDEFVKRIPIAMVVLGPTFPHHSATPDGTSTGAYVDHIGSFRVIAANPAASEVFTDPSEELIGRSLDDLLGPGSDVSQQLVEMMATDSGIDGRTLQLPTSQSIYSVRAVSLPHHGIGLMLDDITHIARTAEALRRQATHDDLTGLPNRAQFNDRLEAAIRACNVADDPTTVAVLMIDLNKFKEVNDTYGHEYGDKVLVEVAKRLTRNIRGCDTIARLGGDEFGVILRSPDAEVSAHDIATRIEQLIRQPFQIMGHMVTIGASIGIAVRSPSLLSARTLVRDADHAMYRAKAHGGGIISHDGVPTTRGTTINRR